MAHDPKDNSTHKRKPASTEDIISVVAAVAAFMVIACVIVFAHLS